ncbi:MAG: 4'-phosphopantetheinyl transferase superfamily protein [Woeseiaceae bacterium]|nr:4'-phosphopantetheinyl transferase superfamily protein [Woeseiaceae bacterium]NIP20835.1 4'-phosphopantetheinyl transferase superfamily protein [Woeseiaceae bacterium]NIS89628.1 4'-phosphopantetheinyl transferase superfamily protein [Woeseiaceae bacterium]
MISIAFAELVDDPPTRYLSAAELERANDFTSSSRRKQFLLSRSLLRALLEDVTGEPGGSFEFRKGDHGKPFCVDGPAISISHSGNFVACAVADDGAIGIDIEFPGRERNTAGIAGRFFSARESRWLADQPKDRFYMLWVLKEAWLKAIGTGLAGGLDSLQCAVTPPEIEVLEVGDDLGGLSLVGLGQGLIGIATLGRPATEILMRHWRPDDGAFIAADDATVIAEYAAVR